MISLDLMKTSEIRKAGDCQKYHCNLSTYYISDNFPRINKARSNTILMISHFWMMISSECKKIRMPDLKKVQM